MTRVLLALLCLAQLAQGASTDSTSADRCPPPDGTTRSLWSILGSCALTLLICVWHTVHFDVPKNKVEASLWFKCLCAFGSFLVPEVMVAFASWEFWHAYEQVKIFRGAGYKWSMTHSFFADMGGFRYRNEQGELEQIDANKFLQLCESKEITNPLITVKEIAALSKSDWLGKAILALQLVWFMLQVIVRGHRGLAITLVELDTVCMAVLSLMVIILWWYKPLRPECPHVFYPTRENSRPDVRTSSKPLSGSGSGNGEWTKALSDAWKPEPIFPIWLTSYFTCTCKPGDKETAINPLNRKTLSMLARIDRSLSFDATERNIETFVPLSVTWFILGGLHLIAWHFEFPTETEKILWRVASLVLAGGSIAFGSVFLVGVRDVDVSEEVVNAMLGVIGILGVVSRALLVGLMLASLRALPCSAHETTPWTFYIPHL